MNEIRTSFSISDLENFTGIKAHTIRAWERRYGLFTPDRTEGNQRNYDLGNLQKLLNVRLLYDHGLKISEIAAIQTQDMAAHILNTSSVRLAHNQAIDAFKISMLNFDQGLFERTYQGLLECMDFRELFKEIIVPLLHQIGLLWQVNGVTPANEHFISSLIHQKLLAKIEHIGVADEYAEARVYVLYLPSNEIHDLGLLFLHYELLAHGKRSIYLGHSVPIDSLMHLKSKFKQITYVSYCTVAPTMNKLGSYVRRIEDDLLTAKESESWMLGSQTRHLKENTTPKQIKIFAGVLDLLSSETWKAIES